MTKFVESSFVKNMRNVTRESYLRYWDERNGGNVSYRLIAEEVEDFEDVADVKRTYELGFDASALAIFSSGILAMRETSNSISLLALPSLASSSDKKRRNKPMLIPNY